MLVSNGREVGEVLAATVRRVSAPCAMVCSGAGIAAVTTTRTAPTQMRSSLRRLANTQRALMVGPWIDARGSGLGATGAF
jgi:hypothetical protein